MDGQPELGLHRDDTLLSCNVPLSQAGSLSEGGDYEGGGTCFACPAPVAEWADGGAALAASAVGAGEEARLPEATPERDLVLADRGDCLMHSGQMLHGGASVTAGRRFLLVFFVDAARLDGDEI